MGFLKALRDILEGQDWGWFNVIRDALIWLLGESERRIENWIGWLLDWVDYWRGRIEDAVKWVLDNLDKLTRFFGELWDRAVKVLTDLYWGLRAWVDTWWNQLTSFFLYDLPKIWDKIWGLIGTVSNWASGIISEASSFLSNVWPVFSRYVNDSIRLLFDLWDLARKSIENLTQKISEVSNNFQNFLKIEWHPFTSKITSSLNSLSSFVKGPVWESIQNLGELFWGWINDLEKFAQLFSELRRRKPKELPTIHLTITEKTPTKMGTGLDLLKKAGEIFLELIIWIIASFAIDVVIDWIFGDYDLETGRFEHIPIEMIGFLEWNVDLLTGEFEVKAPVTTTPIVPMILIQRGGGK